MKEEELRRRHTHHGDDCPHCEAEEAVRFVDGTGLPDGSIIDKSYICDECGKWVNPSDFE